MKRALIILIAAAAVSQMCFAKRYALVIGIGAYPKESGWAAINGDKDIPIVIEMLKINGFKSEDICTLRNEKATKKSIKIEMQKMAKRCKAGDQVYIHYSGHGQQVADVHKDEPDGKDEAWIPYDAKARYEKGRYEGENHILDDELYVWFSGIKDKIGEKGKLTIAVDACHSGDSSRELDEEDVCVRGGFADGTRGEGTFFAQIKNWLTGDDTPKVSKERKVRWTLLSACKPEQTNREYKGTGSLTAALRSIAEELSQLTGEQVRVKVRNWMREPDHLGDHQLPDINDEGKKIKFI